MITYEDYLGPYEGNSDVTEEVEENALRLLDAVNNLLDRAEEDGVVLEINPKTKTYVSGTENGGFRPQSCPVGAPNSKHKKGLAVDVYDPEGELDEWCGRNVKVLEELGLYLEASKYTPTWCHIQCEPPGSGRRFFIP